MNELHAHLEQATAGREEVQEVVLQLRTRERELYTQVWWLGPDQPVMEVSLCIEYCQKYTSNKFVC